jgi:hypothetical protein
VGDAAKNQAAMNPSNTVFDAKRLIGRRFSDPAVKDDMSHWPFKVVSGPAEKPMIDVEFKGEHKQFSAEEISSMVSWCRWWCLEMRLAGLLHITADMPCLMCWHVAALCLAPLW